MNIFIYNHGLVKYAVAAANETIAAKVINNTLVGASLSRKIPVRDLPKSKYKEYAVLVSDPETVYQQNSDTKEWRVS